ncbi:hypothetical protein ACOME3_006190 [Neoechinorhynchus agilis]
MSSSKIWRALILGAPGCGKGTVSGRIVSNYGFAHIPSGDLLRSEINSGSAIGKEASSYVKSGKLVPDSIVLAMIKTEVSKYEGKNWLLDGFPRTVKQAEGLQEMFPPLDFVICLNVPHDEIINRLKVRYIHPKSGRIYNLDFNPPKQPGLDDETNEALIQREDDKPDTVAARLNLYEKQTSPLKEFYRKQGILQEYFGRETNKIWPHVKAYLDSIIQ